MTDLLYSDVEESLRSSVRSTLQRTVGDDLVARLFDEPSTDTSSIWRALAEQLGLAGLLVPESLGGVGAGPREAAVVLEELGRAGSDVELRHSLRDVLDHVIFVNNKIESFQASLTNALMLDSALLAARQNEAAIEQNEQMKRISSWAAILFAPSVIGSVYGMNFHRMPELAWAWGYPMALGLMLVTGVALYVVFKLKKWL